MANKQKSIYATLVLLLSAGGMFVLAIVYSPQAVNAINSSLGKSKLDVSGWAEIAVDSIDQGTGAGLIVRKGNVLFESSETDILNFNAVNGDNDGISFRGQTALSADGTDEWLRLNNAHEFSNGVYTPKHFRADGEIRQSGSDYGGYEIQTSGQMYTNDYLIAMGGIHVGGTSDPGTDNLEVDGTSLIKKDAFVYGNTFHYPSNPVNGSQRVWRLIDTDTFQSSTEGWTGANRTQCPSSEGEWIFGGYGSYSGSGSSKTFSKSVNLSAYTGMTEVKVEFQYYAIDSWDGSSFENGFAKIASGNYVPSIWQISKFGIDKNDWGRGNKCGSSWKDGVYSAVITKPHRTSDGSIVISVSSNLNSGSTDESFGIDNVKIWVR